MGFNLLKLSLKYLKVYRDRHGKTRYYFRKKGARAVRLPDIEDEKFLESYQSALSDGNNRIEVGVRPIPERSLEKLIILWTKSPRFLALEGSTRAVYLRLLSRIREQDFSQFPSHEMQSKHVRAIVERIGAGSPTTATRILRLLKQLMQFSIELSWREDDPTAGVVAPRHRSSGIHSWTDAEIAIYEKYWPTGSYQRLGFALLLYTGQRRSDVVRFGPSDVSDNTIQVTQQKTGVSLMIPIHPDLQRELEAWEGKSQTYLTGARGNALSVNGFYNVFSDWCQKAGLPDRCSPHGLRKAAARRLAEAGCTTHQIAAITGHKTLSEISRYTKAVEQKKLAEAAISKLARVSNPKK